MESSKVFVRRHISYATASYIVKINGDLFVLVSLVLFLIGFICALFLFVGGATAAAFHTSRTN